MTDPTKPGYKTTELWVSVLSMFLTFLAVRGLIQASDINPLLNAFMLIYSGALGVLAFVKIADKYVGSRTSIKTTTIQQQTQNQNTPLTTP